MEISILQAYFGEGLKTLRRVNLFSNFKGFNTARSIFCERGKNETFGRSRKKVEIPLAKDYFGFEALWFGHGCSGERMLLEHERHYGLGMDALVSVCS